jgi:ABC-type oligopeptide transport system substrate-binding subunit
MKRFFCSIILVALGLFFVAACGEANSAKEAEQAKEAMPTELKDSAALQKDEASALDKLNTITDTAQKR